MITRVMLGSGCNPVDLQALHIDKDRDKALLSRASLYVGQQSSRAAAEDLSSQEPGLHVAHLCAATAASAPGQAMAML